MLASGSLPGRKRNPGGILVQRCAGPMETWWEEGNAIPAEVLKERRLASKKKTHDHSENVRKDTEAEMKAADTQQAQVSKENAESGKIEENTETAENMETEKTMPLEANAEEKATVRCAQNLQKQQKRHIQNLRKLPARRNSRMINRIRKALQRKRMQAPTDEDLQAAIEAARQRRLEADKKSL